MQMLVRSRRQHTRDRIPATMNAIKLASEHPFGSIPFPLIGTGTGSLPFQCILHAVAIDPFYDSSIDLVRQTLRITLAPNVACTDYCVAKGGKLVAYRWDGESVLNAGNLRWVEDEMMVCMRPCRRTGGQDDGGKTMGRRDD